MSDPLAPNNGGTGAGSDPSGSPIIGGGGGCIIRPAHLSDLPAIALLWRDLQDVNAGFDPRLILSDGAADWFISYLGDQLDNRNAAVLVAAADELIAGYTFGQIMQRPTLASGDCGYIADLCVRDGWRGRGIGRQLHSHLRGWFQRRGITSIEVQIVRANPASQAFWRKMGYGDFLRTLRAEFGDEEKRL